MTEKLKSLLLNDNVFYSFLFIIVGVSSFGLGKLSTVSTDQNVASTTSIQIVPPLAVPAFPTENNPSVTPVTTNQINSLPTSITSADTGPFVASKKGTKYHLVTCGGAKSIKPENLISFATRAEAEAAGYTKASNCPGL